MKTLTMLSLAAVAALSNISGCASTTDAQRSQGKPPEAQTRKTLRAFGSEQEMAAFFRKLAEEREREARRSDSAGTAGNTTATAGPVAQEAPVAQAEVAKNAEGADDSVTNVQHAGVDEGGIVKVHGDYLVVLRRGRLFTVRVGSGDLRPVSSVDAFGPGIDPDDAWYDEMLVSDETVAVIGYSYGRGGTEIGLFQIDPAGRLTYRSTYHLRSNDYYSSRNYASRLIGSKLIFYTPLYLSPWEADYKSSFPALRRWHRGAQENEFKPIVSATRVYRPARPLKDDYGLALHTVTTCDLAGGGMTCEATAVVGPAGRVFYVSPTSVYVWVTDWRHEEAGDRTRLESTVYRLPLDGSAPTALGVSGSPVDQFSFLESDDGHLNVLVRADAAGDGMWSAEVAEGEVALMRVALESFTDGTRDAPANAYRPLPRPEGYTFQNRFVGEHLLYGTGSGWGAPEQGKRSSLYAVRWAGGGNVSELLLAHGVDRIEVMGAGAVVVGTDGRDLHFTSVGLGERAEVASVYTRRGASQGELRSHGFFYKPDGEDTGTLGLPIQRPGRPGYEHLFENSAAILFLRNDSMRLTEVGELAARPEAAADDACRASCVDWYGNARPLFLRGRVLALLGYEVVEGTIDDGRIREFRRVSFAPRRKTASVR